jgi:hypothetical protein
MKTFIEPFKIKMVEPMKMTTWKEREQILEKPGFNLFLVHSEEVLIDLLTGSGTAAEGFPRIKEPIDPVIAPDSSNLLAEVTRT